jgi:hypothetical protein
MIDREMGRAGPTPVAAGTTIRRMGIIQRQTVIEDLHSVVSPVVGSPRGETGVNRDSASCLQRGD